MRLLLFSLALFLLTVGMASAALGHAQLIESTPSNGAVLDESPPQLTLRFNSLIETPLTRLVLIGGDGREIPLTLDTPQAGERSEMITAPLPLLEAGRYRVRYRVMATDGHATSGVLRFTISVSPAQ